MSHAARLARRRQRARAELAAYKESRSQPAGTTSDYRGSFLDMGLTPSGENVNEYSAMSHTAVFGAIRIRSEAMGTMPVEVFRRVSDDETERTPDHPVARLMRRPNPDMTGPLFRETINGHGDGWGNGRAYIVFDGSGRPVELWPFRPNCIEACRDDATQRLFYEATMDGIPGFARGTRMRLDPGQVFDVPGLGFDGVRGYSPIRLAARQIGNGLAADNFRGSAFKNGVWMSGVFEHSASLSDKAFGRLKSSLAENREGTANAFKPLIAEEGMKWHQVSIPVQDAMLLELGIFSVRDIARIYRIPLHMLADMEKGASFASIAEVGREFRDYTLGRPITAFEEEVNRKLIRSPQHYARINSERLTRGTPKEQAEADAVAINSGQKTPNEARRRAGLPPKENGDELMVQGAMITLSSAVEGDAAPPEPPAPPPDDNSTGEGSGSRAAPPPAVPDALVRLVEDQLGSAARFDSERVRRKVQRGDFESWLDGWVARRRENLEDRLGPACTAAGLDSSDLARFYAAELRRRVVDAYRAGSVPGMLDHFETDGAPLVLRAFMEKAA